MDLITPLVQQLFVGAATQVGVQVTSYFMSFIKQWSASTKPEEVEAALGKHGQKSPRMILDEIVQAVPKGAQLTARQREELMALFVNMSRDIRGLASRETAGSFARRHIELVDHLLSGIETVRRPGENVGPGWDDWQLVRFLGRGSFGEVWFGRHKQNKHLWNAFKFFTAPDAQEWLKREHQNLGNVQNRLRVEPRIVRLVNVVIANQKYPFLVLDYVAGGSLEDWIQEDKDRRPPLRKDDVIYDIVKALSVAHGHGIFHRDLKPGNILLTPAPEVQAKVTDFGLADIRTQDPMRAAKPTGPAEGEPTIAARPVNGSSRIMGQVGTPMYMPPESSMPFARQDFARDDVFAIGVIWYQLLVDRLERPPYDFADVLKSVGVDTHTIRIISECLAQPKRRFKDARALLDAIDLLPPSMEDWEAPQGGFNIAPLAREYLTSGLPLKE